MVTDPIGDFIVQIRNAQKVQHDSVTVPYSTVKHEIGNALVEEGFVKGLSKKGKKVKKYLEVELLYREGKAKVNGVKRISKPGRRVYKGSKELSHSAGRGVVIVSTPKGIMSADKAAKENIGGEVLFSIF